MSFECGETSTKLLKKRPSLTVITVERAVNGCLRDLGTTGLTYGAMRHELVMFLPKRVIQYFLNKTAPQTMKKYRL